MEKNMKRSSVCNHFPVGQIFLDGVTDLRRSFNGTMSFVHQLSHPSASPRKSSATLSNARVGLSIYEAGNELAAQGRWEEALLEWRHALEIFKAVAGEEHTAVAKTLNKIGVANAVLKEPYYAYDAFTKALEIQEETLGPGDRQTAMTLGNISVLLSETRLDMEREDAERETEHINYEVESRDEPSSQGSSGCAAANTRTMESRDAQDGRELKTHAARSA
jgi:tetratricopeptide (TPR) repeat protein